MLARRKMNCIETQESSVISRFCHDASNRILVIEFKHGGVYSYHDVPGSVFEEMVAAPSKGQFFVMNVKEKYRYTRL